MRNVKDRKGVADLFDDPAVKPSDDSIVEARKKEKEMENKLIRKNKQPTRMPADGGHAPEDVGEVAEVLADTRGTTEATTQDTIMSMTQENIDRILEYKKKSISVGEKSHLSHRRASPRTDARRDDP